MPANVKSSSAAACNWAVVTIGTITLAVSVSFTFAYLYHNLERLWH